MFEPIKISPSILSADFMNLGHDVEMLDKAGADYIHVDVMDGHFVPNLSMGIPVLKQLRQNDKLVLDVHLMVSNPLTQIPWFIDAGADIVTVHVEALKGDEEMQKAITMIHSANVRAAFALKPNTPIQVLDYFITQLDMVLPMSVEPGFSGQTYREGSDDRIREIVKMARKHNCSPLIQVDGGINPDTCPLIAAAGADVIVCGNAILKAGNMKAAIDTIRSRANEARIKACKCN